MHNLIKIGEMARLFGLNIRTLRYYDEIGLLKPAYIDAHTGYRYYCIEQFEQLNTIRYFRAQGMSLETIQSILDHRDPQKIQNLLIQQLDQVSQQMEELKLRQIRLQNRIEQIDRMVDPSLLNRFRLCEVPARPYVFMNMRIRGDVNLEMHLRALEHHGRLSPSYFLGKVGLSMSLANLNARKFDHYQSIFCLVEPGETDSPPETALSAGLWAIWRFHGCHADSPFHYRHLLNLLEQKHLKPVGDAAEFTLLDAGLTDRPEDYTTEIQIPVVSI